MTSVQMNKYNTIPSETPGDVTLFMMDKSTDELLTMSRSIKVKYSDWMKPCVEMNCSSRWFRKNGFVTAQSKTMQNMRCALLAGTIM